MQKALEAERRKRKLQDGRSEGVCVGGSAEDAYACIHTCVCVWCKQNSLWTCLCLCIYKGGSGGLGENLEVCFNIMMRVHVRVHVCVCVWTRFLGSMSYHCACVFMSVCSCLSVYVYALVATLHQPLYQHTLPPSPPIHTLWLILPCFLYHHECQDVDCGRLLSLSETKRVVGREGARKEEKMEGEREGEKDWRTDRRMAGKDKWMKREGMGMCAQAYTHTHTHTQTASYIYR